MADEIQVPPMTREGGAAVLALLEDAMYECDPALYKLARPFRSALRSALDQEGTEVQQEGDVQRWTISDVPGGVEEDSLGGLVKYADHLAALQEVEGERDELDERLKRAVQEGTEMASVAASRQNRAEAAEARVLSAEEGLRELADYWLKAAAGNRRDAEMLEARAEVFECCAAALSNLEGREGSETVRGASRNLDQDSPR